MDGARARSTAVICLICFLGATGAAGQEPDPAGQKPTVAEVEKLIEALRASSEIGEDRREAAIEIYRKAIARLKEAETHGREADRHEAAAKAAPEELARVEAERRSEHRPRWAPPTRRTPTAELEQQLREVRAEAKRARATLGDLRKEPERRKARLAVLPDLIAREKEGLDEVERLIAHPPESDRAPEMSAARRAQLQAARVALRGKVRALEAEQARLSARGELLVARIRLAVRDSEQADEQVATWQAIVSQRSEEEASEAEREAAAARRAAEVEHPLVHALAERNLALTAQTTEIAQRIKELADRQVAAAGLLQRVEEEESDARRRIAVIGLTDAIGLLMRRHRARLPNADRLRAEIGERNAEIALAQLQKFEIEAEVQDLGDIDRTLEDIVANAASPAPDEEALRASLRRHLESRLEYASVFVKESDRLARVLLDLELTDREVIETTERYAKYIDAHLVWLRSDPPLWEASLDTLDDSATWLLRPSNWAESAGAAGRYARRHNALAALMLGLVLVVMIGRIALSRGLVSAVSSGAYGQSFRRALSDFMRAALRALPLPVVLAAIGWVLGAEERQDSFPNAVGDGLRLTAGYWLFLGFWKRIIGPGQLAEWSFGWNRSTLELIRRNLKWFMPASVLAVFLTSTFNFSVADQWRSTAGRFALLAFLVLIAVLAWRLFHPRRGLLSPDRRRDEHRGLARSPLLLWVLGVTIPLALAASSALGYHWTALLTTGRLLFTLAWAFLLLIVHSLCLQALAVARFNLERKRDREREKLQEAVEGAREDESEPEFEIAAIDVAAVDDQSRHLLRTFIVVTALTLTWLTWGQMLPPLSLLEEMPLWTHDVQMTEEVPGSDGVLRPTVLIRTEHITLADLVLALAIFIFTGVAVRNAPGLLEVLLLQRLPILESSRYAVATLARYAIAILGIVLGMGTLGLSWSQMQWLVAAMGVGLGFGLQEIFANFVSGLIILFERRIRVGDTITVDAVSGSVTRIRVLATTLSDWDRKEFIIPNKDIISGRVLNWTLSNKLNRAMIEVGVAYGTDVKRATTLLEEVARKHPVILDDPAPVAILTSFDDSALNLSLRYFLGALSGRSKIRSDLGLAIISAFEDAGIEIPFPQRDVHIQPRPERPPPPAEPGFDDGPSGNA